MTVRLHPTAIVEGGVTIGDGTSVWDAVHIRGPGTTIGVDCIIGEKSYVAYGVTIGDRVKINAFVYICTGVTIEDGVMISAGTTFTNDRYPRATTPDLTKLRPSDPDEHTLPTIVRAGTTIGARATIGPGIELGRFAMIGMAAVVTRSVAAVCRCGEPFLRAADGLFPDTSAVECTVCGPTYGVTDNRVLELG